jgi:hypothetical protein
MTFFWPKNKTPIDRFVLDPVSDPVSDPDPKCLFRIRIGSGSGQGSATLVVSQIGSVKHSLRICNILFLFLAILMSRLVSLSLLLSPTLSLSRGGNATPPCSRHLGQVVSGCVTLWRQSCHTTPSLPHPASYRSWEIADSHPNQTICPTRNCCDVLTELASQPGSDFSHRGEKSTQFTYTVQTFSWLLLSSAAETSASGPQ